MKISPARIAAYKILMRVDRNEAFASYLLPHYEEELSSVNRSLCHQLVLGTLRSQIYLDNVIERLTNRRKLDIEVRIAIRIGLYQILFLDKIPVYSAVNESVGILALWRKTSAQGFVNAILRRATRQKTELHFVDEVERLSVQTSHPRWLVSKWIADFGFEQTAALCKTNNIAPDHGFRLLGDGLADKYKTRPSRYVDGCYLTDKIDSALTASAKAGEIYFQDEGSQLVACSFDIPAGGKFLDVCAAPGGKTGLILKRNASRVGTSIAGDRYFRRATLLRDVCRGHGAESPNVVQHDAEIELPYPNQTFDVVFVDAPCTGTGTIRHNPEKRYLLKPEDIIKLSIKQLAMLSNASKLVRDGGLLVYSTCSLEKEENELVCEQFMKISTDFQIVKPNVPGPFITDEGFARTFPDRDNMDGFFIAEFRKS